MEVEAEVEEEAEEVMVVMVVVEAVLAHHVPLARRHTRDDVAPLNDAAQLLLVLGVEPADLELGPHLEDREEEGLAMAVPTDGTEHDPIITKWSQW